MILSTTFRCSAVDVPLRRRISSATRMRHNVRHAWAALSFMRLLVSASRLLLTNCKITANALTKQIRDFAFKRQDIFQKSFNTFVHWFPHFAACWERWGLAWANDSAVCRARPRVANEHCRTKCARSPGGRVPGGHEQCLLLAQSRHCDCRNECPLSGVKRT